MAFGVSGGPVSCVFAFVATRYCFCWYGKGWDGGGGGGGAEGEEEVVERALCGVLLGRCWRIIKLVLMDSRKARGC